MPYGWCRYNSSLIGECEKAVFISTLDKRRDSEAARFKRTLIILFEAASANVSKKLSYLGDYLGQLTVLYICGYYHQRLI